MFADSVAAPVDNGDVHRAIVEGNYAAADLAGEIGDVPEGRVAGRKVDDDITVARLVGIGVQDLAAAEVVLRKAGIATATVDPHDR